MNNRDIHRRVCAYIDLDAVCWNLEQIRQNIDPGTKVMAVIKADGYGHGALPIAKRVECLDYVWGFGCATAEEAFELREHGIQKPILVMGYTFEEHYEQMCLQDITPAVFRVDMAKKMARAAQKAEKQMKIHLAVDTGMMRIGFLDEIQSVSDCVEISKLPGLTISGLFTHFARADEYDRTNAKNQLIRYWKFAECLEKEGIMIPLKHSSNSAGIMNLKEANMDIVRAGIILYGLLPSDEVDMQNIKPRPALTLKSHIVFIKEVPAETPISYGGTYVTKRKTRVATIPVGYGDGYPRSLSNKGYVLIHGKRAPILGRVCMDQFMVDVTEIPKAREEDAAILVGNDGAETITMETLGNLSGRFNYEFACDLGKRIPKVYIESK